MVVVDEAFADALPGEPESLAGADVPGLLVFRSLTKTWALAGLRAGYALGDPALLARLARPRPPWPVSTLALEAVAACCAPEALDAARRPPRRSSGGGRAGRGARGRQRGHGAPGRGPYLLLRLPDGQGERVRAELRAAGVAVRRGDTFPGLSPDHVRVAVRSAAQVQQLVRGLATALAEVPA